MTTKPTRMRWTTGPMTQGHRKKSAGSVPGCWNTYATPMTRSLRHTKRILKPCSRPIDQPKMRLINRPLTITLRIVKLTPTQVKIDIRLSIKVFIGRYNPAAYTKNITRPSSSTNRFMTSLRPKCS